MHKPDPELTDDDIPEWTGETHARAAPFTAPPLDLQKILISPERAIVAEEDSPESSHTAA